MSAQQITELLETIARLRAPEGCAWDREQTHESLIPYLEEESAEVIEAILQREPQALKDELGDLLLQIVLHAQIASEQGQFNFYDIAAVLNEKMVRRHPHVFGNISYESREAQKQDWQRIKAQEQKLSTSSGSSLLDQVKPALSGLSVAVNLQKKAAAVGFDWDDIDQVLRKVEEELDEFKHELIDQHKEKLEDELGDLLFALGNVARHMNLDPERALARTNLKFRRRFAYIEQHLGKPFEEASLEEMDCLWEEAKQQAKPESV